MPPNEKNFMFKKLQGAGNYKQWNRNMTLALQDTKCWNHIMGFARKPPDLKATSDDDEDEVSAEIADLEITISEAVLIHTLTDLDSTFRPYLAILHHHVREK